MCVPPCALSEDDEENEEQQQEELEKPSITKGLATVVNGPTSQKMFLRSFRNRARKFSNARPRRLFRVKDPVGWNTRPKAFMNAWRRIAYRTRIREELEDFRHFVNGRGKGADSFRAST